MLLFFFFQAEDGIRDLVRSRGLGDVYKRQVGDHRAVVGEQVVVRVGLARVGVVFGLAVEDVGLSLIHI